MVSYGNKDKQLTQASFRQAPVDEVMAVNDAWVSPKAPAATLSVRSGTHVQYLSPSRGITRRKGRTSSRWFLRMDLLVDRF